MGGEIDLERDDSTEGDLILVMAEDPVSRDVSERLEARGHQVVVMRSMAAFLKAFRSLRPAALVMDPGLLKEDGVQFLQALRGGGYSSPVVVIGARSVEERITLIEAGADDCLTDPIDCRELSVRIGALLRRSKSVGQDAGVRGGERATELRVGDISMDLVERKVRCMGRSIELLPREFQLLEAFMRRPGVVLTRAVLLETVWNSRGRFASNVVDVQVGNLRRKLDPTGEFRFIVSVRRQGFMLVASDAEATWRGATHGLATRANPVEAGPVPPGDTSRGGSAVRS